MADIEKNLLSKRLKISLLGGYFNYLSLLLIILIFPACSVKQQLKKADKKYEVGEYHTASSIYNRVYPKVKVKGIQSCPTLCNWSTEFSRPAYWSG